MKLRNEKMHHALRFAGEVVAETLWPTRCALCDAPGEVLCESCRRALPYLDWWRACKRCGAPYGAVQCDLCNPVGMRRVGLERLPFAGCASATVFSALSGQLVRVYKDQGEQRLAHDMAALMAPVIPPAWRFDAVTYIPATKAAFRHRGFDHGELLAEAVSSQIGAPLVSALERPKTRDQRTLGASSRFENLRGGFAALPERTEGMSLILVDDVMTTGSTLCAASAALLAEGACEVRCLTFARV